MNPSTSTESFKSDSSSSSSASSKAEPAASRPQNQDPNLRVGIEPDSSSDERELFYPTSPSPKSESTQREEGPEIYRMMAAEIAEGQAEASLTGMQDRSEPIEKQDQMSDNNLTMMLITPPVLDFMIPTPTELRDDASATTMESREESPPAQMAQPVTPSASAGPIPPSPVVAPKANPQPKTRT